MFSDLFKMLTKVSAIIHQMRKAKQTVLQLSGYYDKVCAICVICTTGDLKSSRTSGETSKLCPVFP